MDRSEPRRVEERLLSEVLLALAMAALALVQVTLLPTPLGFPPALMLVVVVCRVLIAVRQPRPDREMGRTLRSAFYGGLVLDLFSSTPLGTHILALLAAATLVFALVRRLHIEGPLFPLLAILPGGLAYELVLALVYQATVAPFVWSAYALVIILPSVLVSLILTLPTFFVLRWLLADKPTDKRPGVF
jgi:rod shape-determining protein MreD